jgi:hypothetical protein
MKDFAYHRLVVGYHGCDRSVAEDVLLNGGSLKASANDDCAVINFAMLEESKLGEHYDTDRGVFVEGDPAYPGAKVFSKTHVQVAVRNPSCVLGYFKPADY